jgi:hypothetical protein
VCAPLAAHCHWHCRLRLAASGEMCRACRVTCRVSTVVGAKRGQGEAVSRRAALAACPPRPRPARQSQESIIDVRLSKDPRRETRPEREGERDPCERSASRRVVRRVPVALRRPGPRIPPRTIEYRSYLVPTRRSSRVHSAIASAPCRRPVRSRASRWERASPSVEFVGERGRTTIDNVRWSTSEPTLRGYPRVGLERERAEGFLFCRMYF